ncbi:alpha-hydroxy-acid oxidizing protein, partial [Rhodococcus fascians]|uniref:alpha-hydroxy-acid oxidizing protein n=1 Tax=Rhodococcoides fascians TaxID=1828 RepID=UPI0024B8A6CF
STDDDLVDSLLQRAENIRADAVVVTLDTTMLGWRPEDLNLGSLPFAPGQGIAQYTSDPVFRRIVHERIKAAAGKADVEVT